MINSRKIEDINLNKNKDPLRNENLLIVTLFTKSG